MDKQPEKSTKEVKYTFSAFPLYEHKTPIFKEDTRAGYVEYGQDNNYPDYLTYLYNRSSLHASIINSKKHYIVGGGWQLKANFDTETMALANKLLKGINGFQTLDEFTDMLTLEWLVYGAWAVRVKWNPLNGKPLYYIVQPIDTIRANADKSEFYISKEWTIESTINKKWKKGRGLPKDVVSISAFDPSNKEGEQLLYVVNNRPQLRVYGLPEYEAGIAAIETEIEIRNFDLNNVKTGFAAGTMITLFDGQPSEEEKKQVEKDLKGKLFGSDNAGEAVFNFQNPGTTPPSVTPMAPNNLPDYFELLDPRVTQAILSGHGVTSPMLVGIKTEGQLGGRSELRTAWEHYYNTYILPRQKKMEKDINYLLSFYGLPEMFELQQLEPIDMEITLTDLQAALSSEDYSKFIKNKMGIAEKEPTETEKLLTTLTNLSPVVANKLMNSLSVNELRAIAGLPPIQGGDAISEPEVEQVVEGFSAKVAANKIKQKLCYELGEPAANFDIVSEGSGYDFAAPATLQGDLLKVYDALSNEEDVTLSQLASKTGIERPKLLQLIENLAKGNYIVSNLVERGSEVVIKPKVNIESQPKEEGVILETKWQYAWVDPSNASQIGSSRDFCREILAANRLYTRAEIDQLQNDMDGFNTDVWRYRGGWYNNPDTLTNTPQCRHFWKSILTRRKA